MFCSNWVLFVSSLRFIRFHLLRFIALSIYSLCVGMWSKNLPDSSLVNFTIHSSAPHCTSPGTPPPHPWGSSSQGWSGSETLLFWWTGWCGSRSSPRQWCAPAARSPARGGTLGSRWRHGSKWLRALRLIFLCFGKRNTVEWELCLILSVSLLY